MSSRKTSILRAACASSVLTALAATLAAFGGGASCASSPDPQRITQIVTPDFDQFKNAGVSALIEKRCGTLDCHGQVGRPLRIYGANGLRILDDAGNAPGGSGTTPTEVLANFQAVVGLEPEQLSRVVADPTNNPPPSLLFIAKPRNLQHHKGGQVITAGDDADRCLTTWVAGTISSTGVDANACMSALAIP